MEKDLNTLRDRAYKIAKEHGFHEKEQSDETYLMLIITEISEAVNADIKGRHAKLKKFERWEKILDNWSDRHQKDFKKCTDYPIEFKIVFVDIKDSVEDELADVAIRLLDFAGAKEINFEEYDIIGCDNNFCGDNSFCEKCYYLCRLVGDNMNYPKLEHKIKVILADVFQLAKRYDIDLFKFIDLKMEYNELRPYKYGKEY